MDPEEMNQEEETMEEPQEVTPEDQVSSFAESVTQKAKQVAEGNLTPQDFVEGCMAELATLQGEMSQESPLGGLGQGNGDFPNLEEVEEA